MTDVDLEVELEIHMSEEHVTARIPLAGHVTLEWLRSYHKLAGAKELPASAEDYPDRTWIVVRVPVIAGRADVMATMDAARASIDEVDASEQGSAATASETEAIVREWWSRQRGLRSK